MADVDDRLRARWRLVLALADASRRRRCVDADIAAIEARLEAADRELARCDGITDPDAAYTEGRIAARLAIDGARGPDGKLDELRRFWLRVELGDREEG